MNRKHNPMVALVALLLLVLLLLCAGCSAPAAAEEPETSPRFIVEHHWTDREGLVRVVTDTETGVQYLWYFDGLTVLQPAPEEVTAP